MQTYENARSKRMNHGVLNTRACAHTKHTVRVVVLPSANTTATPLRFGPVPEIEIAGVATEAIFSPTHHPKTENY